MFKKTWQYCLLILAVLPGLAHALNLRDSAGFVYDIEAHGVLRAGSLDVYNRMYRLRVNGSEYQGGVSLVADNGRQVLFATYNDPATGVEVRRRVYVPARENFARYMEVLYNPGTTARQVTLEVLGNLGGTPEAVDNKGNYLITRDANLSVSNTTTSGLGGFLGTTLASPIARPYVLHYHSQSGGGVQHSLSGTGLYWQYPTITVPAKSTVRVIYFTAQTHTLDAAQQLAQRLANSDAVFYDGITLAHRAELANLIPLVPVLYQVDFSAAPLLVAGETRRADLSATDRSSRVRSLVSADAFALNLQENQSVTINMSAFFEGVMYLFRDVNASQLLTSNLDVAERGDAPLRFTAPLTGTYYLEVSSYRRGDSGPYSLEVVPGLLNLPPQAGPFDFTQGTLFAPAAVTLTDYSSDPGDLISSYCWDFGDNSLMRCGPDKTLVHNFAKPGMYTVSVQLRDAVGQSQTHSTQIPVQDNSSFVIMPFDVNVNGELGVGSDYSYDRPDALAKRYVINTVVPGKTLVVDMQSTALDSYLYLYDAYGRTLRSNDNDAGGKNARLVYTPQHAGRLIVEATTATSNSAGGYVLKAQMLAQVPLTPVLDVVPSSLNPRQISLRVRLPESVAADALRWSFGDASPEALTNGASATHTYASAGSYSVRVYGVLRDGRPLDYRQTIKVLTSLGGLYSHFRGTPIVGDGLLESYFFNYGRSELAGDSLSYLWQFGDGQLSTTTNPKHLYTQPGVYNTILSVTSALSGQTVSAAQEVLVLDRNRPLSLVSNTQRAQPQVILAGFDPMLVDLQDSYFTIFAIVKPGTQPVQSVVVQDSTQRIAVLHHTATYADGSQRFETIFPYQSGFFPASVMGDLFGIQPGEWNIQATARDGQFHTYPRISSGNHIDTTLPQAAYYLAPPTEAGVRREMPQVLGAGVGTPYIDVGQTAIEVLALVRDGVYPLHSVSFNGNLGGNWPMRLKQEYPNGDKLYSFVFYYPAGSFAPGVHFELFGTQPQDFNITAVDQKGLSHRYPELRFGNYPRR